MNPTDTRNAGSIGSGLSVSARTSARTRLSAIEASDEFDTLTDLFLGEVSGRSSASAARAEVAVPMVGNTTTPAESEAAPFTMEESPSPADMARAPRAATTQPRSASATFVECVVIGHVPGLSSAWAKQYAREVSRASGKPVAMLRWRLDEVSVEVIDENAGSGDDGPIAPDLDTALRDAGRLCTRWIVHADAAIEAELAAHPSVRLITLLTGADEAARVAGYGAVKRLAERLPGADAPGPMIRVATIGLAPEQSSAAGSRIVEAVRQFLGRDAQQAACAGRLKAVRAPKLLFMGEPGMNAAEAIGRLQLLPEPTKTSRAEVAMVIEDSTADVDAVSAAMQRGVSAEPSGKRWVTDEVDAASPHELDDAPTQERAAVEAAAAEPLFAPGEPSPRDAAGAKAAQAMSPEPDIAELAPGMPVAIETAPAQIVAPVAIAPPPRVERPIASRREAGCLSDHLRGLHAVVARCPHASAVEIAVDEHGRPHLLVDGRGGDWRINQAVADLTIAQAWLEAYAGLVLPGGGMTGRPVTHVFIDQPKRGRRLLDTAMQVHLLTNVEAGGEQAVVCIDLN